MNARRRQLLKLTKYGSLWFKAYDAYYKTWGDLVYGCWQALKGELKSYGKNL